jgi:hypothetical protein
MTMKKFVGYYIIGAVTKEDAQHEKGLLLWSQTKPNALRRILNEFLLGIYWVDKERFDSKQEKTEQNPDVVLNKVRWAKQPSAPKPSRGTKRKE